MVQTLIRGAWRITMGLLVLLVAIITVSGMQAPERLPGIFDPACPMPCWQGIRPGETELARARTLLSISPFVDNSGLFFYGDREGQFGRLEWRGYPTRNQWRRGYGQIYGRIDIEDGIVRRIDIDFWRRGITLGEVIGQLGVPSYVSVLAVSGNGQLNNPSSIRIIYPALGVAVVGEQSWGSPNWLMWHTLQVRQIIVTEPFSAAADTLDRQAWQGVADRNYQTIWDTY